MTWRPSVLILAVVLLSCQAGSSAQKPIPKADKGVLDLRSWDFDKDGPVSLDGEWEFYWKEFLSPVQGNPMDASPLANAEIHTMVVPGVWNNFISTPTDFPSPQEPVGGLGFATYRIKILYDKAMNKNIERFAFKLLSQSTAYRVYANGNLVLAVGIPGKSKTESFPFDKPQVVPLKNSMENYEVLIHVSNFEHAKGGLREKILFGSEKDLNELRESNLNFELFFTGALIFMGIYHLGLFSVRTIDHSSLYFGLFALLMSLRTVLTGEKYFVQIFPQLPWSVALRLEYLTFYFGSAIFLQFVSSIFPQSIPLSFRNLLHLVTGGLSLLVISFPSTLFTQTLPWMQITVGFGILLIFYTAFRALLKKTEGALPLLLGFGIFALAVINDILHSNEIIYSGLYSPYGFLAFVFFPSFLLSNRFANSIQTIENMTVNLESIVQERVNQLNQLNKFTKLINSTSDSKKLFLDIFHFLKNNYGFDVMWTLLVSEDKEEIFSDENMAFSEIIEKVQFEFFSKFKEKLEPGLGTLYQLYSTGVPLYIPNLNASKNLIQKREVLNLYNEEVYKFSKIDLKIFLKGKLSSILQLPLILENRIVGILCISKNSNRQSLSKEEIERLLRFADQIAGVIYNIKLLNKAEEARREAEIQKENSEIAKKELEAKKNSIQRLNEFIKKFNENPDLDLISKIIFDYMISTFQLNKVALLLVNEAEQKLEIFSSDGFDESQMHWAKSILIELKPESGSLYRTYKTQKTLYLKKIPKVSLGDIDDEIIKVFQLDSFIHLPLVNQKNTVGIIFCSRSAKEVPLSKESIETMEFFADQISGALHVALLLKNTQVANKKAQQAKLESELQKKDIEELNLLIKSLNENLSSEIILAKVLDYVQKNFNLTQYALFFPNEANTHISVVTANFPDFLTEEEVTKLKEIQIPIDPTEKNFSFFLNSKDIFYIPNVQKERILKKVSPEELFLIETARITSFVRIPLVLNNQIIGNLDFSNNDRTIKLSKSDLSKLSILGENIAGIIYGMNLLNRVQTEKEFAVKAHNETQKVLADLHASQTQLIQSEKLAALGQLVAGIAHEINTPIGAIKATATNLKDSLGDILREAPKIIRSLEEELLLLAEDFILGHDPDPSLSLRELREIKKRLKSQLEKSSISDTEEIADLLSSLGKKEIEVKYLPLWKHKDVNQILKFISALSGLKFKSDTINNAVEKTVKIIFALKAYSKKEEEGVMRKANLQDGIETVLTIYHNNLKQGVEVVRDFGEIPKVSCIESDTNQIWTNLTFNAIQAMGNQGKLTVRTWSENEKVKVSFEDTGTGIPKDIQSKIFDAFYTTKQAGEGSGMGLFIVKQIVDKHKGSIDLESEPGRTVFTVTLPL